MARTIGRYFLWIFLLTGCSSQQFCDFHDTAPVIVLPVPDDVGSAAGWGSIMMHLQYEVGGEMQDHLAAAGGPASETDVFQLTDGGDLAVEATASLTGICNRSDRDDQNMESCYERHAGAGLAFRSRWEDGSACVAIGMSGHDVTRGGYGFWCGLDTRHRRGAFVYEWEFQTRTLTHVLEPVERMFIGTNRTLHMLDGDTQIPVRVTWPDDRGFPVSNSTVDALSTLVALDVGEEDITAGYLLGVGLPRESDGTVIIAEVESPAVAGEEVALTPRACINVAEPGFGSVIKLARLEPGGPPVLLASARFGFAGREAAVHIFELEDLLDEDPSMVQCESVAPWLDLRCGEVAETDNNPEVFENLDVDCMADDSAFGVSFDVGNIDDTPEYEVLVGCPSASADGYSRAGAGYLYRPLTNGGDTIAALADSREERAGDELGRGAIIVPIAGRSEPVLAASGAGRVLMFLCSGVGSEEPLWDSPMNGNSLEDARCRNPER